MKKYLIFLLCFWFVFATISSIFELYNRRSLPEYRIPNIPKIFLTFIKTKSTINFDQDPVCSNKEKTIFESRTYFVAAPGNYQATLQLFGKGEVDAKIVYNENKQVLVEKNIAVDSEEAKQYNIDFSTYGNKQNIFTRDVKLVISYVGGQEICAQDAQINLVSRDWKQVQNSILIFLKGIFSNSNRWEQP